MHTKAPVVLWLKRDLRLRDHEAFAAAVRTGHPVLPLLLFEPSVMAYPDWATRHGQFLWGSAAGMTENLRPFAGKVFVLFGEAVDAFSYLKEKYGLAGVFSHEESGTAQTFARDRALKKRFRAWNVPWREFQANGAYRGLRSRKGWNTRRMKDLESPQVHPDLKNARFFTLKIPNFYFPESLQHTLSEYPKAFQPPGENFAWRYLQSFLKDRVKGFSRHISKPEASRRSCSRLSPYLAWGNLSAKQVYQATQAMHGPYGRQRKNFLSRVHWRSHFMQKFEAECRMEKEHVNRGYSKYLQQPLRPDFIAAWEAGQTGFPLVDAVMRCLQSTGWVNFRMRAMVVSFLTHLLWQPWQSGAYHLARLFLDYDPGIHFPQFQMQAGVIGVNTVRIYNPVKQGQEHDHEGEFIRKWVPELRHLPLHFLHEPWKMTKLEQNFQGLILGKDYPEPLVSLTEASRHARETLWPARKMPEVQREAERILRWHVVAGMRRA